VRDRRHRIDRRHLRERLATLGNSLVVRSKVRVHITSTPPGFRCGEYGTVDGQKADDMQRQQHSAHHRPQQRVAIVTDSAADIPEDDLDRLGIHMVPVRVHFGERSYLDKVGITEAEFYAELERNPAHPKTSQPPPCDFRRQF
jgi:dihydroxyacetone kinase-like predicted kinase